MSKVGHVLSLSHALSTSTPVYGGATGRIEISRSRSMECGESSESHRMSLDNHVGTHLDFPAHFCPGGKRSHDYSPEFWHFESVALISGMPEELGAQIENVDPGADLILLKTGFEHYRGESRYWQDQPPF